MKQELLKQIPSITDLLASEQAAAWLTVHPRQLVTDCLRDAVEDLRRQILADAGGRCGAAHTAPSSCSSSRAVCWPSGRSSTCAARSTPPA